MKRILWMITWILFTLASIFGAPFQFLLRHSWDAPVSSLADLWNCFKSDFLI